MSKHMLRTTFVVLAMLLVADASARMSKVLQSPMLENLPPTSGQALTSQKVHDVIIQAGTAHGWHVVDDKPGRLRLHNLVQGKHDVVIDVIYDTSSVRIEYVSSANLNYEEVNGVRYIHPKYIEWNDRLLKDIAKGVSY